MIGDAPAASPLVAALMAEGCRVRQVVPGTAAERLDEQRYAADLSSEDSLRCLREMLREDKNNIGGIVNLLGLASGGDEAEETRRITGETFLLVKVFADDLQNDKEEGGCFVNVTALDGHFGLGEESIPCLSSAGTLGVVKTLRREYPHLRVKNVDFEPAMPAELPAARLVEELFVAEDLIEIGLTRQGRWRLELQEESSPLVSASLPLDRESVVLITGGACGVTAEIARALAAEAKPHLILVGRSPLSEPEAARTAGMDRLALRRFFLDEARARGEAIIPAEVERRVSRRLKDREICATLAACKAAGASVEYHALDVRDGTAFGGLIDNLYERYGRIDGVIHGAGIVEDRRIVDKTRDSFDAVFRTKADSAWTLARKLRPEGLRFLVFFGSVSGRFGNAGQVDYSAANEVLNKLAGRLHRRWPGRVVCLNWGPWEGGMVSEDLRRLYSTAGVKMIPVAQGVAAFLDELRRPKCGSAEVVLACGVKRMISQPIPSRKKNLPNREAQAV